MERMDQEDIQARAWHLVLGYAQSGLEDDIDEDGEFSTQDYEAITEAAWSALDGLKREHGVVI